MPNFKSNANQLYLNQLMKIFYLLLFILLSIFSKAQNQLPYEGDKVVYREHYKWKRKF